MKKLAVSVALVIPLTGCASMSTSDANFLTSMLGLGVSMAGVATNDVTAVNIGTSIAQSSLESMGSGDSSSSYDDEDYSGYTAPSASSPSATGALKTAASGTSSQRTSSDTSSRSSSAPSAGGSEAGGCFENLAHLDSKLPKYPDPELEHTRNVALETDLREVLGNAQAQGHSPSAAASLLLQQAEEYDRTLPQAESCIRESAAGDADRIIAQLQDGT